MIKISHFYVHLQDWVLENIKQNIIGMFYLLKYQSCIEWTPEVGRELGRYYLPSVCHNTVGKKNTKWMDLHKNTQSTMSTGAK